MGFFQWLKRLFSGAPAVPPGTSPFPPGTGPARLIVLRHAEKSGDRRDPHLSLPGRKRAERLVNYIPRTFGRPDFLIAARTSNRSRRPVETLEPLAAALKLEIRAKIDDDDSDELIAALQDKQRYRGKVGVICWRHSGLPGLLQALGAQRGAFPDPWGEHCYTTVIDLTFSDIGETRAKRVEMPD